MKASDLVLAVPRALLSALLLGLAAMTTPPCPVCGFRHCAGEDPTHGVRSQS